MTRPLLVFPTVLLMLLLFATPPHGSAKTSTGGEEPWFTFALERHDDRIGPIDPTGYVTLEIVMPADAPAPGSEGCDPSYPQLCIPHDAEDLDCSELGVAGFIVLTPDPHALDDDGDGLGCED